MPFDQGGEGGFVSLVDKFAQELAIGQPGATVIQYDSAQVRQTGRQ
jgi:hypothetical protein